MTLTVIQQSAKEGISLDPLLHSVLQGSNLGVGNGFMLFDNNYAGNTRS